jgi:hypothetical protein
LYGDGIPRNETQIEAFSNYAAWVASKFKESNTFLKFGMSGAGIRKINIIYFQLKSMLS